MNPLDKILTSIAQEHLGIVTLEPRNSDQLDFHDVAVWSVQSALKAAYEAGAATTGITGTPVTEDAEAPTRFDDYEISPCLRFREDGEPDRFYFEPCEPHEADVWTLYGHIPGQGVEAIGDFATRELAAEVYARITGRRYGRNA